MTTCDGDGRPTGLTVSAFASVSLDPPLVLVCIDHKAQSHPAFLETGRFAVNVLRAEHEPLSRRFASTRLDKFDGVPHRFGPLGQPLLDGTLAWMECVTVAAHPEGDHTIFVGRVEHAGWGGGDPLVYFRSRYRHLAGGSS